MLTLFVRLMVFLGRMKMVRDSLAHLDRSEDPTFPYKVEADIAFPRGATFRLVSLYHCGSQEIVIQAKSLFWLNFAMWHCDNLRRHPRLLRYTITGPNGVIIEQHPPKEKQQAA